MASGGSSVSERSDRFSPGDMLSPRQDDAQADYLQQRVGTFALLLAISGSLVLLVGCFHAAYFLGVGPLSVDANPNALVTHALITGFQLALWALTLQRMIAPSLLRVADLGLVVVTLAARGYEIDQLGFGRAHELDLLMCMGTLAALLCRAVIVPSSARFTLCVGALGAIPALLFAMRRGAWSASAVEAASFSAIWCATAVVLSSFISRLIHGLRQQAWSEPQLGQYVIERKLGEGGMGEVYLARHALLRRPTALKLLPPERAGLQTIARFEREVRATSRLSHPNTMAIYDYGRTSDGVFYYAMEYLVGIDLEALIAREGRLAPERAVHLLVQILGALSEAHRAGLVHRDLKPANVFLCERGGVPDTVKVFDFGLVKESERGRMGLTVTGEHTLIGTPAYLSPEAIHCPSTVDARSDLYAVGAIGYFLLTGCHLFEARSLIEQCMAHLSEPPLRPSQRIARALPCDLEDLILSCLEKLPENRPPSAAALRRALLACDLPVYDPEPQYRVRASADAA
jgi:eukaryotic-like serine/threonine-protein kinase